MSSAGEVVIPKVWRSEIVLVAMYFITSIASIIVSNYFPATVISGSIISFGQWRVVLDLPLFCLIPLSVLMLAAFRIYNVKYVLTSRGIDSYDWVLGPQRVMSIRYEDIRSLETSQSLIGRMLDVGDVMIGTSAQSTIEVIFTGIASPGEVLQIVQRERDRRHQSENQSYPL